MEKNVLKVRMLGTFSLEYKGKELVLDRNKASKTTQLFQLLMYQTEDGEPSITPKIYFLSKTADFPKLL